MQAIGWAAAAVAVAIWAGWLALARADVTAQADRLSPLDVAFLRNLGPALLLAPVWARGGLREWFAPSVTPPLALAGLLCWGAPFAVLLSIGLGAGDTTLAAMLAPGAMPLVAALLTLALTRARPSPRRALGLGLVTAAIGVALVGRAAGPAADSLAGAPYILAAAALWACYTVAFPYSGLSPARAAGVVGLWSTLGAGLVIALWPDASRLGAVSGATLAVGFLAHGVLAGALSVLAFSLAIARLGAARAAACAAAVPGLAAGLGWAFLGDPVSPPDLAALALGSAGVLALASATGTPRRRSPPA